MAKLPLEGVRVLEPAILVAAPFGGSLLADFGAEVIKLEMPGTGDQQRTLGPFVKGTSLWWKVISRNKKSVTLDLRHDKGQALFKRLVEKADVVIENFRPGTMERWGLGWEELRRVNPRLIFARGSGFGQTGPYSPQPSFGNNVEAYAALTNSLGYADTPPVTSGLGDHIPAILLAYSIMVALYHRDAHGGAGQMIDAATTEGILRVMSDLSASMTALQFNLPKRGKPPSTRPSSVGTFGDFRCTGLFRTKDGRWINFIAATRPIWDRLMKALHREDYLDEESYPPNSEARKRREEEIHCFIEDWFSSRTREEALRAMAEYEVTVGPVYDMADVLADPHFQARRIAIDVDDPELGPLRMMDVVPRLSETPGRVDHAGPSLGEHNQEIYSGLLGVRPEEMTDLKRERVI